MAISCEDRDGDSILYCLGEVYKAASGYVSRQLRNLGLVPASGDIQHINTGIFQQLAPLYALFKGSSALHELVTGNSHGKGEIPTHSFTHSRNHLQSETAAVFKAASILIFTKIGKRGKKLADQITRSGSQLHAVKPGCFGADSCLACSFAGGFDLFLRHGTRRVAGHLREHRRR